MDVINIFHTTKFYHFGYSIRNVTQWDEDTINDVGGCLLAMDEADVDKLNKVCVAYNHISIIIFDLAEFHVICYKMKRRSSRRNDFLHWKSLRHIFNE